MDAVNKITNFALQFIQLEFTLMAFLLVLALLLMAVFGSVMALFIRRNAYETQGKILGAVSKEERKAQKDGTEKLKQKYRLVYEYKTPENLVRQRIASDWSSSYAKLTTGSTVNIKVIADAKGHDNVSFAENHFLRNLSIITLLTAMVIAYLNTRSINAVVLVFVMFAVFSSLGLWFFERVLAKQDHPEDVDTKDFDIESLFPIENILTPKPEKN